MSFLKCDLSTVCATARLQYLNMTQTPFVSSVIVRLFLDAKFQDHILNAKKIGRKAEMFVGTLPSIGTGGVLPR